MTIDIYQLGIASKHERQQLCRGKSFEELRKLFLDGKISINDVRREISLPPIDDVAAEAVRK